SRARLPLPVEANLEEEVPERSTRLVLDLHDGPGVEWHLEAAEVAPAGDDQTLRYERDRQAEGRSEEVAEGALDAGRRLAVPVHATHHVAQDAAPAEDRGGEPDPDDAPRPFEV